MVCLDTDILVGLLKGDLKAINTVRRLQDEGTPIRTTAINAYELLKGAMVSLRQKENLEIVRQLLSSISVLPLSKEPCEEASKIHGKLREDGQIIGEFDILIASITIIAGETLISRDGHFHLIESLSLQTW